MASYPAPFFVILIILTGRSAFAQFGLSNRYECRKPYFRTPSHATTRPVTTSREFNRSLSSLPPTKPDLQAQFLSLFTQNEETLIDNCRPQVVGNLNEIEKMCGRKEFFYGMNPRHREAVNAVSSLMRTPKDAEGIVCLASQLKNSSSMNPIVWIQSLMSTVLHNPEMNGLQRPSLVEILPSMLIYSNVMTEVRRMATLPRNARGDGCIVLDGSYGTQNGIENVLWYWREDIMLNAHHWYWHLTIPFNPMMTKSGQQPPRPDRRGELFSYTHAGFLARYHSERLSNGLRKVVPHDFDFSTVIEEPYYANLDGTLSGVRWTDRPPNALLRDILINQATNNTINSSIAERRTQLNRVLESIDAGHLLLPNNETVILNNTKGIDLLGDIVEASIYSVNPSYYGRSGIHNAGHILLGLIEDPEGRRGLPPGVIGDTSTSMRDPIFYRYHKHIADILDRHKRTLPPYHPTDGEFALSWSGVHIEDVEVIPKSKKPNKLKTYWNQVTYDLSRGIDFNLSTDEGPINACVTHLDYEHFDYKITINKDASVTSPIASVRIFLAPHFDEDGRAYTLYEQRLLFFPLDYFTVELQPGRNIVRRRSTDSSLTISWPQRLEELESGTQNQPSDCGCGYPQHLLLPKGTKEGMLFDLFVMATNQAEDAVPQRPPPTTAPGTIPRPASCVPAPIYCGVIGELYPDSKPMGYPFDRLPYSVHDLQYEANGQAKYSTTTRMVNTLHEYIKGTPNMAFTQVKITHMDS